MSFLRLGMLVVLLQFAITLPARGATAVFVQGVCDAKGLNANYSTSGTSLQSGAAAGGSFGGSDRILIGRANANVCRGLLRFDISSLAGRVQSIQQARLVLTVLRTDVAGFPPTLPSPATIKMHRLLVPDANWLEGGSTAGAVQAGAACWTSRSSGGQAWSGTPGCGLAGTDYVSATAAAAARSEALWVVGETWTFDISDLLTLQSWSASNFGNGGWLLRSDDLETTATGLQTSLISFHSDDAADPNVRPRLEIDYTPLAASHVALASVAQGALPDPQGTPLAAMASSILSGAAEGNFGAASEVNIGIEPDTTNTLPGQRWRGLFKFDLSHLQAVAPQIEAVDILLTFSGAPGADAAPMNALQSLPLYVLRPANAAWQEGTRSDGGFEASTATWGWLAEGAMRWAGGTTVGLGVGAANVDYDTPPLATLTLRPSTLTAGGTVRWRILDLARVEDWIAHPENNAGLKLESPTLETYGQSHNTAMARLSFHSDDAAILALRPTLNITYRFTPQQTPPESAARPEWLAVH